MRVSAEVREATRSRILAAALQLFEEEGWHASTTRDIAAAASIATGTLFNYFPTKEAIASTIAADAFTRAGEEYHRKRHDNRSAPDVVLEEDLFLFIWTGFRHLLPYRKFIAPALA